MMSHSMQQQVRQNQACGRGRGSLWIRAHSVSRPQSTYATASFSLALLADNLGLVKEFFYVTRTRSPILVTEVGFLSKNPVSATVQDLWLGGTTCDASC